VRDDGDGIPAESLPHVFERFYRLDSARDRESGGSGIGLAIAKALVGAHGGRITAESSGPGQGATFTIILPVAAPKA
jgi:signal transduction histidine kinase